MKIHQLPQGTQEWHELRANFFTASEAPAMMGASSKVTRNELLRMKATGTEREYSEWVERNLFDKGHQYEAAARPIVEARIGEELFPVTGTRNVDGLPLLASLDGCTMLGDTLFEHKMWNESLAAHVRAGDLPAEYYWQLEQQLLVSSAEKVVFVTSDGTEENFEQMIYAPVDGRAEQLIAGWKQFEADLAAYEVTETKPEVVGKTPDNLPALRIELRGEVSASNLAEFKAHAFEVLSGINRNLVTDQDFADAEKTVKWCKDVEDKIAASKANALSQTVTIEEAFRLMDDVSEEVRRIRLELDRLVKAEKENRRNQILAAAADDFNKHIAAINYRLQVVRLPAIACDIVGAMKGKRTIETLENAAQTAVANAKVEANQLEQAITTRLELIAELGVEHPALFPDKQQLVQHDEQTLRTLIDARIAQHTARLEAQAKEALERERIAQEREAAADAKEPKAVLAAQVVAQPTPVVTLVDDEAPTLRLGQISERLGFSVTADFLQYLGFEPASRERSAVMFHEHSFGAICDALISHINAVHESHEVPA